MNGRIFGRLLIISGIIGGLVLVLLVLHWSSPDAGHLKELAGIVQAFVTVLAIVSGGIFAFVKWELFRAFVPHLTIQHEVSHRPIGTQYVHIAVKATLRNSSKVRVIIRGGIFRIHQISPLEDEEVEDLYSQVFETREFNKFQWPTLDEVHPSWEENNLVIEPGESPSETVEFIVAVDHKTVLIYTYFYNPYYSERAQGPQGWDETTIFDLT